MKSKTPKWEQPGDSKQLALITEAAQLNYEQYLKPILVYWDSGARRYRLSWQINFKYPAGTMEVIKIPK